jgi:flagellar hook-associated protein 2
MATITAGGVGSGLDVEGIVSKLMEIERKPITRLTSKESVLQTKLSAYGTLKGYLSGLQTAADTLALESTFTGKSSAVSDTSVISAAATADAAAGSYGISVTQLAKHHTLRTTGLYAATSETFNTGSLAISVGGVAVGSVTIDGTNNTLAGIRQAINDAGLGVTASIVNDGTTNRLLLRSDTSGSEGAINILATDSGAGGAHALTQLDEASLATVQTADNALFSVNGLSVSRSSNTVSDVIDGVTFNLLKGTAGSPGSSTLTISKNTAATTTAVENFVKAYNTAVDYIKSYSGYNAATKVTGAFNTESTVRSIRMDLGTLLSQTVSGLAGGIDSLSSIGVAVESSGKLVVDNTKLQAALTDPAKDVKGLFTQTTVGNEGIAVRFASALDGFLAADGLLAGRTDGINSSLTYLDQSRQTLTDRLEKIEQRYRAKFATLDAMASSMSKTSQYLSSQISTMNR